MNKIDALVMKKTFSAAEELQRQGVLVPISFNVTCSDITNKTFIDSLQQLVDQQLVPANMIEIELTESQAMEDYKEVNPVLEKLLEMGVKVNIDDFGTGYSSLSYLHKFSLHTIKIDRSFINQMERSEEHLTIVKTIAFMCSHLKLGVIAEGVESDEHIKILKQLGILQAQGYRFSKPVPADEAQKLIVNFNA